MAEESQINKALGADMVTSKVEKSNREIAEAALFSSLMRNNQGTNPDVIRTMARAQVSQLAGGGEVSDELRDQIVRNSAPTGRE